MKRLLTLAIVLLVANIAFGQDDYKHPLSKKNTKETTEQFQSVPVKEEQDYKHPKKSKTTKRIIIRHGKGANAAASTKHPLG
ncbi:MAG: hypothetical protein WDO14_23300 [Bacteroidota bacterium]